MPRILHRINHPQDLRPLSMTELEVLAQEIREVIIATVDSCGGHLAANLGVVELTLALHRVLESPRDKLIWDVGHQSYAHKLITGRRERFSTLRQYGGISGFPRREESEHDPFGTGHSSTSISAALGLAQARDRRGEDYRVVAVIGDGSLTGGMALEALNHAGSLGTDLLVLLNDNEMSIAENVGAISRYLSRMRLDPTLSKAREELERLLASLPAFGGFFSRSLDRLKDSLKQAFVPGMFFEELGFSYFGPIDGHNLRALEGSLRDAFARKGPVLLHVLTKKGKGYRPAEADPEKYHGVAPGGSSGGEGTTGAQILGRTLGQLAAENDQLVAITAAMPEGTGLSILREAYPDRVYDVGIAEQHALTLAAGMAAGGLRPVVAVYASFLQRAIDQLIHDICLQNLPVVIAIDRAGLVGEDGPTHHGILDLPLLLPIPNLTILAPKDGMELEAMLRWAFEQSGPVAIRYPRGVLKPLGPCSPLELGRGEVLRIGEDVTLLAVGSMVRPALEAASILEGEGLQVGVLNTRFLKPFYRDQLESLSSRLLVTVEENSLSGGFGPALGTGIGHIGLPDRFIEQGPRELLWAKYGLDAQGIAAYVRQVLGRRG
ncbi:MAG: 1-deoxy-D-xylulose-5-phosphate synthase [Limnochordia bacterium]